MQRNTQLFEAQGQAMPMACHSGMSILTQLIECLVKNCKMKFHYELLSKGFNETCLKILAKVNCGQSEKKGEGHVL